MLLGLSVGLLAAFQDGRCRIWLNKGNRQRQLPARLGPILFVFRLFQTAPKHEPAVAVQNGVKLYLFFFFSRCGALSPYFGILAFSLSHLLGFHSPGKNNAEGALLAQVLRVCVSFLVLRALAACDFRINTEQPRINCPQEDSARLKRALCWEVPALWNTHHNGEMEYERRARPLHLLSPESPHALVAPSAPAVLVLQYFDRISHFILQEFFWSHAALRRFPFFLLHRGGERSFPTALRGEIRPKVGQPPPIRGKSERDQKKWPS